MVDSQVLKRLDFPAYCIKLLDNGLIALTGGGGTSKTGVGNSIELGFVTYSNKQHAEFNQIHKFESDDAIMKFVSFTCERNLNELKNDQSESKTLIKDLYLAAAVNQTIEIYKIQPNINKITCQNEPEHSLVQRKKSTNSNGSVVSQTSTKLEASASIKLISKINLNDPNESDSSSNKDDSIVTIQVYKSKSSKQILLCAGTAKGNIQIWNLQIENNNNIIDNNKSFNFEKLHTFNQAHSNEIDDLQVNSDGLLLSIGKDSKCFVWSLETLKKVTEFDYIPSLNNDKNLRIKHARFSVDSRFFYATFIPRVRGGTKNMSSFIQRWIRVSQQEGKFGYKLDRTERIRNTILTCIQTSKDGYFVCAGDCDGKIYLYDYEFNKLVNFKKQHSSVITDLVFYYDQEVDLNNQLDLNKFILTISIDRTLQLYKFLNLNLNLTNKLLFNLDSTNNNANFNFVLYKFVTCCLSINFFKLIFILIVFFVLFCYFFTYIE